MKKKILNYMIAMVLMLIPASGFAQTINLGTAAGFVLFTTNGAMTCSGTKYLTHLTGNVGSNLPGSVTGFGNVDGVMHAADVASGQAAADLLVAYTQLNTAIPTGTLATPFGNGNIVTAGVYSLPTAVSTLNGTLILDAQGDPNAVFIFQVGLAGPGGTLNTNALSNVKLINGALACNVFWKVEGAVNMATGTSMKGTIVAHNALINMVGPLDTLEGRALSINGAVSVTQLVAYTPIGCGSTHLYGPIAPTLDTAGTYGAFSSIGAVTSTPITYVKGNVGSNSTTTTGFNPLNVTGTIHTPPDASTAQAASGLTTGYNYLVAMTADIDLLDPADFGHSLVLTPHAYQITGITQFTDSLYLNAQGDPNAVFVIKINGAFTTTTGSKVFLINGTQAKNVYWKIDGAVNIFSSSVFNGTIVAAGAITLNTGDTLNGRALTINGAVAINGSYISAPPPLCNAPAIVGSGTVCKGSTTTLTDVTGGKWYSGDTSVASIDSLTGVLTGKSAGNSIITFAITASGCTSFLNETVNPIPANITGFSTVCVGATDTLSDTTFGGTWSSSNPSQGSIGSTSGILTGISGGTTVVSYISASGCAATKTITINPVPNAAPISGPSAVCVGTTITLTDATPGGVWTSNNTTATVVSGIVTGVSAGVDTIKYTVTNTCGSSVASKIVTVVTTPSPITGPTQVCEAGTITLADGSAGGTWSSSNPLRATVGSVSGIVTGVTAGTAEITYSLSAGCTANVTITINPLPNAGTIAGPSSVCTGSTITLTDAIPGGIWSATNASATVVSGSVTGVTTGVDTIMYQVTNGCGTATATKNVTVNLTPNAGSISGLSSVCVASSIVLTDAAAGGAWSSSNATAAVVGGTVTGVTAGVDTIAYTIINGCGSSTATKVVTVNPLPNAGTISGASNVCTGATITLTDAAGGGVWSATNGHATVSSGIVSGNTAGIDTVMYAVTNGCGTTVASKIVTINASPAGISGILVVCTGLTTTLSDVTAGGTWSSSNTFVATVGSLSGVVSGVTSGISTITYLLPSGCTSTAVVTVKATPNVFANPNLDLCNGATSSTISFTGDVPGTVFSWSNNNTNIGLTSAGTGNIAPFVATNGVSNAIAGTVVVIPSLNGCTGASESFVITIEPTAGVVTPGNQVVCNGNTTAAVNFTGSVTGATYAWANNNTSTGLGANGAGNIPAFVATNGTNIPETSTITVMPSINGCNGVAASFTILVNPTPNVGGFTNLLYCNGSITAPVVLTGAVTGTTFTWVNSNTGIGLGASGTGNIPSFTAINTTNNQVVATINVTPAANGCTGLTKSFTITLNTNPTAPVIATSSPATVCDMTYFHNFGAATLPPAGIKYSWSAVNAAISDSGTTGQYALVNFKTAGNAVVMLTATSSTTGCKASAGYNVAVTATVADVPAQVIYFNHSFVCLQNDETAYAWGYDDAATLAPTAIAGEMNQDYDLTNPDFTNRNYWVKVSHNGCIQKTYSNKPTNAAMKPNTTVVTIYPNPADSKIDVTIATDVAGDIQMEVVNMLGQRMYAAPVTGGSAQINVSAFASGTYMISCYRDGQNISTTRFIKN